MVGENILKDDQYIKLPVMQEDVLKKLSDKKQIDWNTEKTNHDYLKELKSESSKTNFAELLYIFEYVWYGEFEINEEAYLQFKKKFEANI